MMTKFSLLSVGSISLDLTKAAMSTISFLSDRGCQNVVHGATLSGFAFGLSTVARNSSLRMLSITGPSYIGIAGLLPHGRALERFVTADLLGIPYPPGQTRLAHDLRSKVSSMCCK